MILTALQTLIFKELGKEYHRINISDNQFQDIIVPRALNWFAEHHDDGTRPSTYELDLVSGTHDYTLDSNILYVVGYFTESIGYPISRRKYLYEKSWNVSEDIVSYSYSNAYLSDLNLTTGIYHNFKYNSATNIFTIRNIQGQSKIYLDVFINDTIDNAESIYENYIFQKLVLGHSYILWGYNLNKFEGQILGGRTINWREMVELGKEILEETKEEVLNEYSEEPEWEFG